MLVLERKLERYCCPSCHGDHSFPELCPGAMFPGKERKVPSHTRAPRKSRLLQRRKPVVSPRESLMGCPSVDIIALSQNTPDVNIFPVERDSEIASALQYYFEVFKYQIHPYNTDAPKQWQHTAFSNDLIQTAMSDPMWFCANVAFSEGMKDRMMHDTCEKSEVVAKYQSKAFMDMRKRLMTDQDNDILLLTITVLMSIDILFGSTDSMKMHAEGLDRIIQLRGGLESINHLPYLKQKVIGFQQFWHSKQIAYATAETGTAKYPKHPFPPDLCIATSKLPKELAELALSGTLSIALIRLVADVAALQSKFDRDGEKRPEDLHYATWLDKDRAAHWLLGCVIRVRISPIYRNGVKWEKKHSKVLVEAGALSWRVGNTLLEKASEHVTLDRDFTIRTCKQFIWDDVLTEKLEAKFDFETTPSTRRASSEKSPSPLCLALSEQRKEISPPADALAL
ncbi:uncharacterized protein AB675_2719 [Cyphellophora attinorum]|uniref:Transcription factor domain-containing protein n=1 Tax=Cyphellophora attinorum TaxID=1664694 RepID=A0A0N1P1R4_9EURO|nr:uncharacterized protein AB675_2719 [Phialophora attinorum]KPI44865.1 hypothetical protein AB675_2719 [Phialophora attinorum]